VSDDFLSRWSRRKREAARAEVETRAAEQTASDLARGPGEPDAALFPPEGEGAPKGRMGGPEDGPEREKSSPGLPDLPPLPSLDEITAATDLSAFMHPAVPDSLRHAALRKMWSIDPTIRDFVSEGVDYAWNFNAPEGISGWGRLGAADDVARMVSNLIEPPEPLPATGENPLVASERPEPEEPELDFRSRADQEIEEEQRSDVNIFGSEANICDVHADEWKPRDATGPRKTQPVPGSTAPPRPKRRHGGAIPA
jgi:hypothetical protein